MPHLPGLRRLASISFAISQATKPRFLDKRADDYADAHTLRDVDTMLAAHTLSGRARA